MTTLGVVVLLWALTQQDIAKQRRDQIAEREDQVAWQKKHLEQQQQAARKEIPANAKIATVRRGQMISPETGLNLLEKTWGPNIAYTKIEVNTADHDLKLEMESRTLNDALALVDTLQKNPGITRVNMAHQGVKITDPFKPTQSVLEVVWREPQP
ncbi:hypothetical protein [Silvimonas amylolytica]|uniref:Uncharacterized protein n=1 Tax=Silvimonas amylolytica TaxID=449663 RepID=A0ABQ2PRL4_9NEIS|nr:hypothetical protein [Silvimonas amylolytica]GGP27933.1 hypothetical protein GCM10010971_37520 [Silvimonas amylolytica]